MLKLYASCTPTLNGNMCHIGHLRQEAKWTPHINFMCHLLKTQHKRICLTLSCRWNSQMVTAHATFISHSTVASSSPASNLYCKSYLFSHPHFLSAPSPSLPIKAIKCTKSNLKEQYGANLSNASCCCGGDPAVEKNRHHLLSQIIVHSASVWIVPQQSATSWQHAALTEIKKPISTWSPVVQKL